MSIDMNGLKIINDNYGHDMGDRALVTISDAFRSLRSDDFLFYRLGGDEFATLCFVTNKEEVENTIDKIKEYLSKTQYSVSIGYSELKQDESVLDAYKRADELMYEEKKKYHENKKETNHKR